MLCQLTRGLGLVCCSCSSAHSFALRLPSDGSSRFRPCLRLILVLTIKSLLTGFTYRGLSPPLVHARAGRTQSGQPDANCGACFGVASPQYTKTTTTACAGYLCVGVLKSHNDIVIVVDLYKNCLFGFQEIISTTTKGEN